MEILLPILKGGGMVHITASGILENGEYIEFRKHFIEYKHSHYYPIIQTPSHRVTPHHHGYRGYIFLGASWLLIT
jgi:hypothetical protein